MRRYSPISFLLTATNRAQDTNYPKVYIKERLWLIFHIILIKKKNVIFHNLHNFHWPHWADEKWHYIEGLLEVPCVVYEKSENK